MSEASELGRLNGLLGHLGVTEPTLEEERRSWTMSVSGGVGVLREALGLLEEGAVSVVDAGIRHPTLDDVFLTLTGHDTGDEKGPSVGTPVGKDS